MRGGDECGTESVTIEEIFNRQSPFHSDFGVPGAAAGATLSAGAGAAATGSTGPGFLPPFFAPPSRGTNFFLGLGNSKASPLRFCAVPPAVVIFWCADLLYQPATIV